MLSYIGEHCGEDAVYEIHRKNIENTLLPMFHRLFETKDIEEKIRKRAAVWTHFHMISLDEIEEDNEKFTFKIQCDSGGSIRQWPDYGKTKEGHPWSYGEKGFCYYCGHCPIFHEIMPIEKYGFPNLITDPQPGGKCYQYLYKDPEDVPEKYYNRIGLKKRRKD